MNFTESRESVSELSYSFALISSSAETKATIFLRIRQNEFLQVPKHSIPDCAVKDLWSKEREKKDNRSSGLG